MLLVIRAGVGVGGGRGGVTEIHELRLRVKQREAQPNTLEERDSAEALEDELRVKDEAKARTVRAVRFYAAAGGASGTQSSLRRYSTTREC